MSIYVWRHKWLLMIGHGNEGTSQQTLTTSRCRCGEFIGFNSWDVANYEGSTPYSDGNASVILWSLWQKGDIRFFCMINVQALYYTSFPNTTLLRSQCVSLAYGLSNDINSNELVDGIIKILVNLTLLLIDPSSCNESLFNMLMKVLLTVAASIVDCERFLSKQKHIFSYMRASISQSRERNFRC